MLATRIYLDTWLLRALISDKAQERSEANHEISKLRSQSFESVIPQIVLGETVSTIMRDFSDPNDIHNKLAKLYDSIRPILNPRTCLPPPTKEAYKIAEELKNADGNLRDTDLLIVAQALIDPESERLLTPDKDLLDSEVIREKEKEMREIDNSRIKLLKIVDGL